MQSIVAVRSIRILQCPTTDPQAACKIVFMAPNIGSRSLAGHVENLQGRNTQKPGLSELQQVILFRTDLPSANNTLDTYSNFLQRQHAVSVGELAQAEAGLAPEDVLNLQFTSGTTLPLGIENKLTSKGTTGSPKAAMLTNVYVSLSLSVDVVNAHS